MKNIFTFFIGFLLMVNTNSVFAQTGDCQSGTMAFGCRTMYNEGTVGHIKFDVDDPTHFTHQSSFSEDIIGGAYYYGYYYVSVFKNAYADYPLYRIDHNTGVAVHLADLPSGFLQLTYDYANNIMYGYRYPAQFYSIDLSTGDVTFVNSISGAPDLYGFEDFVAIACDLEGNMYGIGVGSPYAGLYSINVTQGTCTLIGTTGMSACYGQSMAFDHATGTLYWCRFCDFGSSDFCTVNTNTGKATSRASYTGQIRGLYFPYIPNTDIAEAPTDFTVTPVDTKLAANLAWTNPATTVAGDALSSITKIVVERNGMVIREFNNPVIGDSMGFTDIFPSVGTYHYSVYAVTSEGNGLQANTSALIGGMCEIKFLMWDSDGDGWNNANISVTVNGTDQGAVTLSNGSYGEEIMLIPAGEAQFTWEAGLWDMECSFQIYNFMDEMIYESSDTPVPGTFLVYENHCDADNPDCEPAFNFSISTAMDTVNLTWDGNADGYFVMRDGIAIDEITSTSYTDIEVASGWHSYCIFAKYDDCISVPVCDNILVSTTNIYEDQNNILIYPNPASDIITVVGKNISEIKIYNCIGQLMLIQQNVNEINVSKLENGIYILNIETMDGSRLQRKIIISSFP